LHYSVRVGREGRREGLHVLHHLSVSRRVQR
jgi:hypothetical protein